MKLPCDICMWGLIPMIKRELVLKLHDQHHFSNADVAARIGVTKGSVTQYIQGKRACDSVKLRRIPIINSMINKLADDLAKKRLSPKQFSVKFCKICKAAQKKLGVC